MPVLQRGTVWVAKALLLSIEVQIRQSIFLLAWVSITTPLFLVLLKPAFYDKKATWKFKLSLPTKTRVEVNFIVISLKDMPFTATLDTFMFVHFLHNIMELNKI